MNHFVPDFDTDDDYVNVTTNSSCSNLPTKPIIGEEDEEEDDDDLMELLWHNGQVVLQNQRLNAKKLPFSSSSSSSAPPPPPHQHHPLDHNLFIQEDEMTSWLHYPLRDDDFCSDLLFSTAPTSERQTSNQVTAATPPILSSVRPPVLSSVIPPVPSSVRPPVLSSVSPPVPSSANPPVPSSVRPPVPSSVRSPVPSSVRSPVPSSVRSPVPSSARPPVPSSMRSPVPSSARPPVRNFMNFSRLRGDSTGGNGRGESGPSISKSIVRESTQVNPSVTPSSAASESGVIRRTDGIDSRGTVDFGSRSAVVGGGAYTFGLNRKGKAVATAPASENPGASSVASKSEIEPVNEQPETGKTIVDERKRKEREAIDESECRDEEAKQGRGSTSTKRSRAAQVHNLSERKRRDRINERMKALQELIPRCNKSDKASMLDEAIEYMKSLQLQIQMMSMGCGMMPMMYTGMQQYMPHMAMGMGMGMEMGMNRPPPPFMPFPNMLASQRPLPADTRMGGYPVHVSDPSRVYVSNQQFDPNSSQAQYLGYMDPYQQFRCLHPSQPPQFQNEATSYPSRVSTSKESEDQGNQTRS